MKKNIIALWFVPINSGSKPISSQEINGKKNFPLIELYNMNIQEDMLEKLYLIF